MPNRRLKRARAGEHRDAMQTCLAPKGNVLREKGGQMLGKAAWTLVSVIVKSVWKEQYRSKALLTSSCLIFHGKLVLDTRISRNAWSCAIERSPWPGWLLTCHRQQQALLLVVPVSG